MALNSLFALIYICICVLFQAQLSLYVTITSMNRCINALRILFNEFNCHGSHKRQGSIKHTLNPVEIIFKTLPCFTSDIVHSVTITKLSLVAASMAMMQHAIHHSE